MRMRTKENPYVDLINEFPQERIIKCPPAALNPTTSDKFRKHRTVLRLVVNHEPEQERPPVAPAAPAQTKARRTVDNRKVVSVVSNPKRPGSASHARFALWRVGSTVTDALAAGVLPADVRWDVEHGYVVLV